MIFWLIAYILTGLPVACLSVYALFAYSDKMNTVERLVVGMIGATMILRLGQVLGRNLMKSASPFDDWSISLLNLCLLVGAICLIIRGERALRS